MSGENELLLFHVCCYQCVYNGVYFVHCFVYILVRTETSNGMCA